jgi:hypothetical protein
LPEQLIANHQAYDLPFDGPVIPQRVAMSHTGLDQRAQIVAQLECHSRPAGRTHPTQDSKLHSKGLGGGIIPHSVSHRCGLLLLTRVGLKYAKQGKRSTWNCTARASLVVSLNMPEPLYRLERLDPAGSK